MITYSHRLNIIQVSSYCPGSPVVTIASFVPQLGIITSKQRPRKLTIHGSDGEDYAFLLKGHEDLRQDERVMQVIFSPLCIISSCDAIINDDKGVIKKLLRAI